MNVDTMRKIDYWAGIPCCFIATFIVWFLGLFASRPVKPQRLLFVELSEMGSAIIADPAMRKARRELDAELYFVIFRKNRGSLALLNTIPEANIYTIRADGLVELVVDTIRFFFWTRKVGIDAVVDLELFSRYSALLTGLSGAASRVGFHAFHNEGLYRGEMLTHRVAYNPHQHIARNFIALINALLAPSAEVPYSKTLIGDEETRIEKPVYPPAAIDAVAESVKAAYPAYDRACQRLILINPNASDLLPQRRWMPEKFVALMQRILDTTPDAVVLITGSPDEKQFAENLRVAVGHERCVNFAGGCRFSQLPHLYTLATLMVTNDSGPGHFSSVTDMPTFVLFGPETPALYGSLGNFHAIYAGLACSPCVSAANHRKTACSDNRCLQVIEPESVFERLRPLLEARAD